MLLADGAGAQIDGKRAGFSQRTHRLLTAMRVAAYSLSSLFMIVMILRGVWLTTDQMQADAAQTIAGTAAAIAATNGDGDAARYAPLLRAMAVPGVTMRLEPAATPAPAPLRGSQVEYRALPIAGTRMVLAASIDHGEIRSAAWRANLPYIGFVAMLGLPTVVIFLWMGWLVNQPALRLLRFAQAHSGEDGQAPQLPSLWASVAQRLKQLRDSQAQMQAFLDNAPVAMAFIDPATLNIAMINRHGAAYYGLSPDDMQGKGAEFLRPFFPDFDTLVGQQLTALVGSRKAVTFEVTFTPSQAAPMQLLATIFPVFGEDDKIDLVGWITVDVSEERHARDELTRSAAALNQSEKLAALGGMLAGVSHELNNPLAAVIGQAALLAEDLEDSAHLDRITRIRRAADRCARIVQSFLAMARQKEPEYRSVDLGEQVRAAVELTEYQMRAASVRIDLRLQKNLPAIQADPDQLHQVIVNLLTNARQALEDVTGERRITISTSRKGDVIRLTVADNGKGIDAATRARIFDPFFTTKAAGSGTGIGLSFSLGIIEAHGGTLTVEDVPVGTLFAITLPVRDSGAKAEVAAPETNEASAGRALVIDDEEDVADTLADMLRRMGMDVTVALGGQAGQAAMADGAAYDLVLSDIRMPGCDGPMLHAWMSANRPDLIGRIAFVTGDTLSGVAADFIAEVGCMVLEKPFTPKGLRALVQQMLKR